MTNEEFNSQFDVLYNNIASNQAPGLNAYEKSVFLTQAQEELVLILYSGRNDLGESFESCEEMRRYLSNWMSEATLTPDTHSDGKPIGMESAHSRFFTLPDGTGEYPEVWLITYEAVHVEDKVGCTDGSMMDVVPVTQDEYNRIRKNPFRGANRRRALRLDLADGVIEIICNFTVQDYYLRYLKRLSPIILEDLEDGLTIGGISEETPCQLHEALHLKILERAVQKAAAVYKS